MASRVHKATNHTFCTNCTENISLPLHLELPSSEPWYRASSSPDRPSSMAPVPPPLSRPAIFLFLPQRHPCLSLHGGASFNFLRRVTFLDWPPTCVSCAEKKRNSCWLRTCFFSPNRAHNKPKFQEFSRAWFPHHSLQVGRFSLPGRRITIHE
jgi:hypothetical protein